VTGLFAATAAFVLTHFVSSTPLRPKLVAALGEWPYRGVYSAIALVTLVWMAWAYAGAPREAIFVAFPNLPYAVMPLALVLIACGYWRNPTIVGAEKLLKSDEPARGMIRITRHPIMWGIMLWAAAHVLARGDVKSLVFFGGLLLVAAVGTLSMDARKKSHPDWPRFAAVTSNVPFVAILQRRNRLDLREIGWLRPAIGLAAFLAILAVHP
jgi:uncharacterized membrane protein